MINRPEYIKCILDERMSNLNNTRISYCGSTFGDCDWAFVSIDHAINNHSTQGRLVLCRKCKEECMNLLNNVASE